MRDSFLQVIFSITLKVPLINFPLSVQQLARSFGKDRQTPIRKVTFILG